MKGDNLPPTGRVLLRESPSKRVSRAVRFEERRFIRIPLGEDGRMAELLF